MTKAVCFVIVLLLAGCAGLPAAVPDPSACVVSGETSYACQVERYHNVNV